MPLKQCPWMGLRDPLPATPPAGVSAASLDQGQNFAVSFSYLITCLGLGTCLSALSLLSLCKARTFFPATSAMFLVFLSRL